MNADQLNLDFLWSEFCVVSVTHLMMLLFLQVYWFKYSNYNVFIVSRVAD